jgi:hypothetical protein
MLADVDADDLSLYKVDIYEDLELIEKLEQKMSDNPPPLFTSMRMTDLYREGLPERSVHILVRPPSGKQLVNVAALYEFADNHASIISGGRSRSLIGILSPSGSGKLYLVASVYIMFAHPCVSTLSCTSL